MISSSLSSLLPYVLFTLSYSRRLHNSLPGMKPHWLFKLFLLIDVLINRLLYHAKTFLLHLLFF